MPPICMFGVNRVILIIIFMLVAAVRSDEILDATIWCPNPTIDIENDTIVSTFGGYTGAPDRTNDILLGRESDTGTGLQGRPVTWDDDNTSKDTPVPPGTMFPTESTVEQTNNDERRALIVDINAGSGAEKVGAFFATARKDSKSQDISIIILPKNADVIPLQRSITVSIGDHVTLQVSTTINTSELKWKLNNVDIPHGNSKDALTINNIRSRDGGIYECYKDRNGKHAMMRLIVRGCPTRKHGPECDDDCPVCYNGGICDHVTGLCVCPPGFKGANCSEGCGNNHWGRTCVIRCATGGSCSGILLCPPDPVGCSCIAGFQGDTCEHACTGTYYGAGCSQECHCSSANCDNERGCQSGATCINGYEGNKCLDYITCFDRKFGEFCQYSCHCATSSCDKDTGYCDSGNCEDEWGGNDCQIALPYLFKAVQITDVTATNMIISYGWTFGEDYGTGPASSYQVLYKSEEESTFTTITTTDDVFTIIGLPLHRTIEVKVRVCKNIGGRDVCGPNSPVVRESTICSSPLVSPHITVSSSSSSSLTVAWKEIDNNPEKIQCNTFDYDVYCESDSESRTATVSGVTDTTIGGLTACKSYTCKVRIENNAGFKGPWSNNETVETHANVPGKIDEINVIAGINNISLTWNELGNGDCHVMYNVTYQLIQADMCEDVHVDAVEEGPFDTSSYIISNLSAYSKYVIYVTSVSNSAVQPSDFYTVQTDEDVPTGSPTSLQVEYVKSNSVSLSWKPPKCGNRKGLITYDYKLFLDELELRESKTGYADTQTTIDRIDTTKVYTFEIEARTSKGIGPKKDFTVIAFKHTDVFVWCIVGLLTSCVVILIIVVVLQKLHYKRKSTIRSKKITDEIEMQDGYVIANQLNSVAMEFTDYNRPVKINDLHMYIRNRKQGTSFTFRSEFEERQSEYARLRLDDESDSSNACYINDKSNAYIAFHGNGQGKQLLEIIMQENIDIIINSTFDGDKTKVNSFWQEGTGYMNTKYGKVSVRKLEDQLKDNGFTTSKFEILTENRESPPRVVHQYNCTAWPADVMDTSAHLIEFTHSLRKAKKDFRVGPILVYSTDCHKIGTVIAVNAMLNMAEESSEIDVFNFVKDTLSNCPHIRLKENQYVFIYEMILECLFCEATCIPSTDISERYKEIKNTKSLLGRPVIQEQINNIEALLPKQTQSDNTLQLNVAEPLLISVESEDVVYSNTKSTKSQHEYLVPRESMLSEFSNFWEMIYDYKSYTVVMLDDEEQVNKRISTLVPERKMTQGQFTVEVLYSENHDYVLKRTLKLTKNQEKPREICHLTFLDWPKESQKPSSLGYFKQLCDDVRKVQPTNNRDDYHVTVCSLDESRSGFFCAVDIIVRKMNEDALVDVYHTVKRIKRVSSSLFDTKKHYELCYEMANVCAAESCDIYESIQ